MATLNVKTDYGAVGDGATDDTQAIQNALDDAGSGDTVYLPGGNTFRVNKGVTGADNEAALILDNARGNGANGVTIEGDGDTTTLELGDGHDTFTKLLLIECNTDTTGVVVQDMILDMRRSAQVDDGRGICLNADDNGNATSNDVTFQNLAIRNAMATGMRASADGTELLDSTVTGAGLHGASAADGAIVDFKRLLLKNNPVGSYPTYQLDIAGEQSLVEDIVMKDGNKRGFKTASGVDVTFRRVRCDNHTQMALLGTGTETRNITFDDVVITNNGSDASLHYGVRFDDPTTLELPADSELVVYNTTGDGVKGYGDGTANFDGVYHSHSNDKPLYADDTVSGYISDLQSTNDSGTITSGGLDVQSTGSNAKTDLSNVPTESDVGAWTSTDTKDTDAGNSFAIDGRAINIIGSAASQTATSTFTWNTTSNWDSAQTEYMVHHEQPASTDFAPSDSLEFGYASYDYSESGLVAYWPFHEDSGSSAADIAGGNDASIINSTPGATGVLGDTAFQHSKANDQHTEASTAGDFDVGDEVTMMCWINIDDGATPDANWSHFFGKSDGGTSVDYGLVWTDNNKMEARAYTSGGGARITSNDTYDSTDNWLQVVLVHNSANELRLYVNGAQDPGGAVSTTSGSLVDTNNGIHMGGHKDASDREFPGRTAEHMIFDRALSETEILQYARAGSPLARHVTGTKTIDSSFTPSQLRTTTSLNGGSIDVIVKEDTSGGSSATHTQTVTLNGGTDEVNSLSGFSGGSGTSLWLEVQPGVANISFTAPIVSSLTVE